ncbi:hypothetical protein RZS08_35800, partial [Arthrospira platensis SPKY1]|nr:hypothetical protein [Arthrospira platensis SPKY1]
SLSLSLHACILTIELFSSFAPLLTHLLLDLSVSLINSEFFPSTINELIIIVTVFIPQRPDVALDE